MTEAHGLVAFLLADWLPRSGDEWRDVVSQQDTLFAVLDGNLRRHDGLRSGRQLAVPLNTATVFAFPCSRTGRIPLREACMDYVEELAGWIDRLPKIDRVLEHGLNAALQRVTTIKPPKKRNSVTSPTYFGAPCSRKSREASPIWTNGSSRRQSRVPEGPQRIRGLAGSGKTVVLALKAAYWHAQHPDWNIALTFQSRALYQQIDDLVTQFTFEHSNDRPDPERLHIMHSWGSRSRPGVYSVIAEALGEVPRDWAYARGQYGQDAAFQGICQELLEVARTRTVEPLFDGVLIDEAQDLPPEFFQLVYLSPRIPSKSFGDMRLQKLSEISYANN